MQIDEVTEKNFTNEVLKSPGPVLVDFWASWCPPCKMMETVLADLAKAWAGTARVVKVNVDRNPLLATQYEVSGVPTFILFENGEVTGGPLVGAQTKNKLTSLIPPTTDA